MTGPGPAPLVELESYSDFVNLTVNNNTITATSPAAILLRVITSFAGRIRANVTNNRLNSPDPGSSNSYLVPAAAESMCILLQGNVSSPPTQTSTLDNSFGGTFQVRSGSGAALAAIDTNNVGLNQKIRVRIRFYVNPFG